MQRCSVNVVTVTSSYTQQSTHNDVMTFLFSSQPINYLIGIPLSVTMTTVAAGVYLTEVFNLMLLLWLNMFAVWEGLIVNGSGCRILYRGWAWLSL